ncbi:hypothetical protein FiCV_gp2 [Finch circovirus]|uniref:Uncharacterized protein n=1 Tax=Finch circovirus TaxID=400122 RepID=Q06J74_9CIRC|nr:hypothetical protein FiCV_gp2 [Finch circovirus]ABI54259.1 hypothetical protein [Finch circovirus]
MAQGQCARSAFGRPSILRRQLWGCKAWPTLGGSRAATRQGTALRAVNTREVKSSIVDGVLLHALRSIFKSQTVPNKPSVDPPKQGLQVAFLFIVPVIWVGVACNYYFLRRELHIAALNGHLVWVTVTEAEQFTERDPPIKVIYDDHVFV